MRNIEISRITDAYRQEAREAVLKAVEKHRGYFRMLVQSNMEQEDCYFVDKAKRKIKASAIHQLFYYARRNRMIKVTSRLPHQACPDVMRRTFREPELCDMPKAYTNLEALVPNYNEIISALIAECRIPVPETEPGTVNIPADASEL
ncbi:MAG: hypothetical protein PUH35_01885 [Bacteroidales bacterium]|uniref:hypothetical protein n=1 Tax=Candidatus Cryptobacteroides sp. TaxID=2952915 RepID=UPI002A74BAD9|nr:hypothetical protein [Candidatus Cryptobacteroides sp.]MDD7234222.1 hypothetical protein [Bacteroidales bacterium]MDY2701225.1 hypothetical protein [Candidatus Cryptobacteroides sp.]MDY5782201.1 hypothetical protein [Candidatus Cryptobacteroides sp.]